MNSSSESRKYRNVSPPPEGSDPWCDGCYAKIGDGPEFRIQGRDGRWPPSFCSLQCAARWGCAADQDRIYRVEEGRK